MFTFLSIQEEFINSNQHAEAAKQLETIKATPLMTRIFMRGAKEQGKIKACPDYPGYAAQAKRYSSAQWNNIFDAIWHLPI